MIFWLFAAINAKTVFGFILGLIVTVGVKIIRRKKGIKEMPLGKEKGLGDLKI